MVLTRKQMALNPDLTLNRAETNNELSAELALPLTSPLTDLSEDPLVMVVHFQSYLITIQYLIRSMMMLVHDVGCGIKSLTRPLIFLLINLGTASEI